MGKIKIHAGDFISGGNSASFNSGYFTLCTKEKMWLGETISARQLASLEMATEESVKRLGGAVGWGLVGGALFGPVGLLAGLLAGDVAKM